MDAPRDRLFKEMWDFAQRWNRATRRVLDREIMRKDVKDTEALQKSLEGTTAANGDKIIVEIGFLLRGRFVDMGVGNGRGMETRESNTKALREKRWYSPAWYGRLNTLQGVVGIKVMEEVVDTFKQLEDA